MNLSEDDESAGKPRNPRDFSIRRVAKNKKSRVKQKVGCTCDLLQKDQALLILFFDSLQGVCEVWVNVALNFLLEMVFHQNFLTTPPTIHPKPTYNPPKNHAKTPAFPYVSAPHWDTPPANARARGGAGGGAEDRSDAAAEPLATELCQEAETGARRLLACWFGSWVLVVCVALLLQWFFGWSHFWFSYMEWS